MSRKETSWAIQFRSLEHQNDLIAWIENDHGLTVEIERREVAYNPNFHEPMLERFLVIRWK